MKKDYLKIIRHYGILSQIKHWYTEVFELTKEIADKENKRDIITPIIELGANLGLYKNSSSKEKIKSELADNFNFLRQIQYYYGISDNELIEECKYKNKRQLERMKNGKLQEHFDRGE